MAENLKKHLGTLSKRGPHRVLVGDLAFAGLDGKVYAPAEGNGVPAVAFGHDWMKSVKSYHTTLRHLASWGIVVVAPDTEKGFIPDHRAFASDLESALQIAVGVKMGTGNVTVAPGRVGIVGHGMGAAAAIIAAANNEKIHAVAAAYPADSNPSAEDAARNVKAPGLIIGAGKDNLFETGNPASIAVNWGGDVAYRETTKANQYVLSEDTLYKVLVGQGKSKTSDRELVRGLITGFLLHELAGEGKYSAFSAEVATGKKIKSYAGEQLLKRAGIESSALSPRNDHRIKASK